MSLETPADVIAATVGAALRRVRLRRGLTTRQVAAMSGVSQSFLSSVENGRTMPSVPSLYAIAGCLNIAAAELLPESFAPLTVTRAGLGVEVPFGDVHGADDPEGSMTRLSGASNQRLDVYEFIAAANGHRSAELAHPGEDLAFVIAGGLTVHLDEDVHVLGAGDSLWWDARRPHSFEVAGDGGTPLRALILSGWGLEEPGERGADDPASNAPSALAVEVGRAIAAERRNRGLSMRKVAERAGVSQPFLSSVENGRSFPGVPLLYTIARVLDVPPSRIMPRGARQSRVHHGGGGVPGDERDRRGIVETPLSFERGRLIEAHHLVMRRGYDQGEPLSHAGEDFVHVLAGEVLLRVGEESVRLRRGDSARFDARLPHELSVATSATFDAEVLFVTGHA